MIIPDINVLLFAYDMNCDYHEASKTWLETCMSGKELIGFPLIVCFGFISNATNPRIFTHAMKIEALSSVDSWLNRPHTIIAEPRPHHLQIVQMDLKPSGASGGNLVTDAHIAALAVEHKATVHTADHDFRRFPHIKNILHKLR